MIIRRDLPATEAATYDLVIVGGGIYGIALTLESARRGYRPLLLERDDFGSHTSWNSLRIVHGGLRYLQQLDLRRFRQSVSERTWFMKHFADLVQPLECLMPLYGRGLKRNSIFRLALATNDLLMTGKSRGPSGERLLPMGKVLSRDETLQRFPLAQREGLQGGALWFDAMMPKPSRLMIEMLRWATACGATALNYTEATGLEPRGSAQLGVEALDQVTGRRHVFKAPVVVNSAGPWCREVASRLDRDIADLHETSIAFNVLLDIPNLSAAALALEPVKPNPRTYFLVPVSRGALVGTFHAKWKSGLRDVRIPVEWLDEFLADLALALPALKLGRSQVRRVDWGFLPTDQVGSNKQSRRPIIVHHQDYGGIRGLFSISGVKFTTARLIAEGTVNRVENLLGNCSGLACAQQRPAATPGLSLTAMQAALANNPDAARDEIRRLVSQEAVVHLDDLLIRRTDWGTEPGESAAVARAIAPLIDWPEEKIVEETDRFESLSTAVLWE